MERVDVDAAQLGGKVLGCRDMRGLHAGVRNFWVQTGTELPGSRRLGTAGPLENSTLLEEGETAQAFYREAFATSFI